jgi:heptosyltransferase-3
MDGPDLRRPGDRIRALAGLDRPRVTVVRAGGLGDSLLVLPAIRLLRTRLPGAWVTWVGSHWAEALRPLLPFPLEVVRFDAAALAGLFAPSAERDPVGIFSEADAVVLYSATPDEDLARNAARLCRGPVILCPSMPPAGEHAAVHYARATEHDATCTPALPDPPDLAVPADLRLWGRSWLDGRLGAGTVPVAIHPGSGGRRKCWPADRFADVAGRLGRPVLAVEGPADADAARAFLSRVPHGLPVAHADNMTLPQLCSLLACSALCIGNDSGVSHLAAALGLPTVSVFGPTDPACWAPRGPRAEAVTGPAPGTWPEAAAVLDVVRKSVAAAR